VRLTPLDVQNHQFARRLRGCDPEEVQAFLRLVAEDLEDAARDTDGLRHRLREIEARAGEMSAREETLRSTLMTAQAVSEDLRRTATKEAEVILAEAEVKAEKILDAAHRRVARLAEEIREMRQLRTRLAASVRAAIETHLVLLDGLAAESPEDALFEGKVAFLLKSPQRAARPGTQTDPASEAGGA
jgi:cell division initiation protein